jgi:excisionase family DNA binding protein
MPEPQETETLDLLWGAEKIAEALGRTKRSVFHLLENGELPARKVGGRWVVSRRALLAHFEERAA